MDLIEGDFVHQVLSNRDLFLSLAHIHRQAVPHRIVRVQSMLPVKCLWDPTVRSSDVTMESRA